MINGIPPSPAQLAAEAREALRKRPPLVGHELFVHLVRRGFINSKWEVTRIIGGDGGAGTQLRDLDRREAQKQESEVRINSSSATLFDD